MSYYKMKNWTDRKNNTQLSGITDQESLQYRCTIYGIQCLVYNKKLLDMCKETGVCCTL